MFSSKSGVTLLALLSGCIACVGASLAEFDPYTSPNGDGCVDPKGFQQCYQEAAATAVECGGPSYCENDQLRGARSYTECLATCKSIQSENNLLCWVQSCWNKGFSCEYQVTAIEYFKQTSGRRTVSGGVPFYPPPEGAEGSCSCNLANVESNMTLSESFAFSCTAYMADDDASAGPDCLCCVFALGFSGLSICPGSDLSMFELTAATIQESVSDLPTTNNCAILDKDPSQCASRFNITLPNVPVVNPAKLPAIGTKEITNLPGNAFSTEAGGEVVTFTLQKALGVSVETITLAPANGNVGEVTGTAGSGAATRTDTAAGFTGTATGGTEIVAVPQALWIGCCVALLAWSL